MWSPSAFFTHSAVSFFIKHLALGDDVPQKPVSFFQSPLQCFGRANQEIHREGRLDRQANPYSLVDLIPRRHHYEDIDVAVGVRLAVGVGAEEDDLLGAESLGYVAGK